MADAVDFNAIFNRAMENLREVWKVAPPEVRNKLKDVASALDTIEGDRQYLEQTLATDEQAEYRQMILSHPAK